MDNKIHIACATNKQYQHFCLAMIASVCTNTRNPSDLCFYIGVRESDVLMSESSFSLLRQKFGCSIEKITIPEKKYHRLKTSVHKTSDAYSKIFLPKLVQSKSKRLIYLDCDVIVRKDIRGLWVQSLNGKVVGAVRDTFYEEVANREPLFNSGVLLFDVEKYCQEKIEEKTIAEIIQEKPTKYWLADQDELNDVLENKWQILPPEWNVSSNDLAKKNTQSKNPNLVHFTGSHILKPDHILCDNTYKKDYFKYLSITTKTSNLLPLVPTLVSHIARVTLYFMGKIIGKTQ